jgi:hypothetical protein
MTTITTAYTKNLTDPAGSIAASLCAATAGFGCVLLAGTAIGGGVGTFAHVLTALALGEEITMEKALTWLQQSLWAGASGGYVRGATGRGPAMLVLRGQKPGMDGLRGFFSRGFWGRA